MSHAGYVIGERRRAGSQGQMSSDLATTVGPGVLWLRVETLSKGWVSPDDTCSGPKAAVSS